MSIEDIVRLTASSKFKHLFQYISNMTWNKKTIANIALVLVILDIARLIATFFQTEYTLTSPLIPASTIIEVARPYLLKALFSSISLIPALVFYFYSRYIVTIIMCAIAIVLPVTIFYFL